MAHYWLVHDLEKVHQQPAVRLSGTSGYRPDIGAGKSGSGCGYATVGSVVGRRYDSNRIEKGEDTMDWWNKRRIVAWRPRIGEGLDKETIRMSLSAAS
jgi:hypothetical protein